MNKKTNAVLGVILVILGALFLLKNMSISIPFFNVFNFGFLISKFWPALFLILPGLIFHYGFVSGRRKDPGLLVPGGILLVLGIAFQIGMLFGGWDAIWPLYIFSVAFGLFELYIFGNREKGLLIPVCILGGLSVILFSAYSMDAIFGHNTRQYLTPLVLIAIGLIVIFGGRRKKGY